MATPIMKFDIGFHGQHFETVPGYVWETNMTYPYQGHATERGIKSQVAIIEAIKEVLGDEIGLAIDCGPGQSLQAVMTLAKELWSHIISPGLKTRSRGPMYPTSTLKHTVCSATALRRP